MLVRGKELFRKRMLLAMAVVNFGVGFVFLVTFTKALVKETDVQKDLEATRRKQPLEYQV